MLFKTASDRKSTRLNSSHTEIYTLSLHDALPIYRDRALADLCFVISRFALLLFVRTVSPLPHAFQNGFRSEEHTSELQSHRDLHSFPTRRSSDLSRSGAG